MTPFAALLAFIVIYMPYQSHYSVTLPVPGVNLANLLFGIVLVAILTRGTRSTSPTPLKGPFLAFIAALSIAFLVGQLYDSSQFADDLIVLKTHVFYLLFYFLFYHAVQDTKTIRILFAAILVATVLVALQCIRQGIDYGLGSFAWSKRAYGPFATNFLGANFAATFFIIFVPLFFAVWLTCKSRLVMRLLSLPGAALGIFGAMFTFSRQAFIILPALFLAQALRRNLGVALLLLVVLGNYELWAPAGLVDRLQMTKTEAPQGAPAAGGAVQSQEEDGAQFDESTESRFLIWGGAMQMFVERPWGVGLGHFGREIGNYVPSKRRIDSHNAYVRVLAECGVLGIVTMVWLLIGLLRLGGKVQKLDQSEDSRLLGGGFTIAALGVVLSNIFGTRIFDGEVMGNFWILAALVARHYTILLEQKGAAK